MNFYVMLPSQANGDTVIETIVSRPLLITKRKLLICIEIDSNELKDDITIFRYLIFLENGKGELVGPYSNDDYIDFSQIETKKIKVIAVRDDDYSFEINSSIVSPLKNKDWHVTTYKMDYEIIGYFKPKIELIANEILKNNKLIQSKYNDFISETENKIIEYLNEKLFQKLNTIDIKKILSPFEEKELLNSTLTEVMEEINQKSDLYFEILNCNYRLINSNIEKIVDEVKDLYIIDDAPIISPKPKNRNITDIINDIINVIVYRIENEGLAEEEEIEEEIDKMVNVANQLIEIKFEDYNNVETEKFDFYSILEQ